MRLVLVRAVMPTSSSEVKPLLDRLRLPLGAMYAALTLPLSWSKMDGELRRNDPLAGETGEVWLKILVVAEP